MGDGSKPNRCLRGTSRTRAWPKTQWKLNGTGSDVFRCLSMRNTAPYPEGQSSSWVPFQQRWFTKFMYISGSSDYKAGYRLVKLTVSGLRCPCKIMCEYQNDGTNRGRDEFHSVADLLAPAGGPHLSALLAPHTSFGLCLALDPAEVEPRQTTSPLGSCLPCLPTCLIAWWGGSPGTDWINRDLEESTTAKAVSPQTFVLGRFANPNLPLPHPSRAQEL
jgi:hypothetical protein